MTKKSQKSRNNPDPPSVDSGVRPTPGHRACEFCRTRDHTLCPRQIPEASRSKDRVWHCPCYLADPDSHQVFDKAESGGYPPARVKEFPEEGTAVAQVVKTTITSDLTGKEIPEGEEAVIRLLTPEGVTMELDCSTEEQEQYRKAFDRTMAKYLKNARKAEVATTTRRGRRRGDLPKPPRNGNGNYDAAQVRAWANEHNIEVNERGRIPATVIQQYEAANA